MIEGRDPNRTDLDGIVKRTVDYMVPIFKRERATDIAYDELEKQRKARMAGVRSNTPQRPANAIDGNAVFAPANWLATPSGQVSADDPRSSDRAIPATPFAGGRQVMDGSPLWTRLRAKYAAQDPRYHRYEFIDCLCNTSNPRCTMDGAYDALQREAVPGRPTNGRPVGHGEVSPATAFGMGAKAAFRDSTFAIRNALESEMPVVISPRVMGQQK